MSGPISAIARAVRIIRRLRARLAFGSSLAYGTGFVIGPRPKLARGRHLSFGNRVNIAADFTCMTHVTSGDDIMISSNVAFIGDDHSFDEPSISIQDQHRNEVPTVSLGGNNLIGYGTIVVGPVTIGRGTIVGAGSLVTTDLPDNFVCVGRPARPVRARFEK